MNFTAAVHDDVLIRAGSRVGTVLREKYRLDRVLGVGGMAVVYAATHRNQRQFAVKILHPELSIRGDLRERFLREGYAANSVQHPGVVAVLDDDVEQDGTAFLVMELLEGASVEELRSRFQSKLSVRGALAVAHQLLDVLRAAHAKAVVHRDIKPANLFLCTNGQLKVLDFGIARLRDISAGPQATASGAFLGTPAFMAPEQVRAQGGEIDARTDIWGVGATLFTILSGEFVHGGGDNGQLMFVRAATTPARSLANVAPDCPRAVVDLVAKALAFDKASRWESADAMAAAVAHIHQELFREPPAWERLKDLVQNRSASLVAASAERAPSGERIISQVGPIAATARPPSGAAEDASRSGVSRATSPISRITPGQGGKAKACARETSESTWSGPQVSLRVWQPARNVVAHKVKGHLNADGAKAIMAEVERRMGGGAMYVAFNDWYEMQTYDSESRIMLTDWVISSRSKFSAIHILVRSKIVSMGVSVANLAVGGLLSTYASPASFRMAMRAAVAKQPPPLP